MLYLYIYIYIYIYILNKKTHFKFSQLFQLFYITFCSVCRRLCKTTKIFVRIENMFFLFNIHSNTSCFWLFSFCIYIYIYIILYILYIFIYMCIYISCILINILCILWFENFATCSEFFSHILFE